MHFQFTVAPPTPALPIPVAGHATGSDTSVELLRQMLDVQREHLGFLQAQAANADAGTRWKNFLTRWNGEFPGIGRQCKEVLPAVERAWLGLIHELTSKLREQPADELENEFALAEFLDRYATKIGQLGLMISQLGPLADAAG